MPEYSHEEPPSFVIRNFGDGAVSYVSASGPMRSPMDAQLFYEDQAHEIVEGMAKVMPEVMEEMGMGDPLPQEVIPFGQALNEYSNRLGRHEKGPLKIFSIEGMILVGVMAALMALCSQ